MPAYVALLRAVNLGPHNKVKMSDLAAVVEQAGHTDVTTYIQSGNVVFNSRRRSAPSVQSDLEQRLAEMTGKDLGVVVRTAAQIDELIEGNPLLATGADFTKLAVAFVQTPMSAAVRRELGSRDFSPERVVPGTHDVYLHFPNGQGRSKLKLDPPLSGVVTVRNWNTVLKLGELLDATAGR